MRTPRFNEKQAIMQSFADDKNSLRVLMTSPFWLEVQSGRISNLNGFKAIGKNLTINTSGSEDIINAGGTYIFPTIARTLSIVSTSANDTALGTGARAVQIDGLNGTKDKQLRTIALNGLTPVVTVDSFSRVNDFRILDSGSSETNEGVISCISTTDLFLLANIQIGEGRSTYALHTVPNNTNGYLTSWWAEIFRATGSSSTKEAQISIFKREEGGSFQIIDGSGLNSNFGPLRRPYDFPELLLPKTDIIIKATSLVNNSAITAGFEILDEVITP